MSNKIVFKALIIAGFLLAQYRSTAQCGSTNIALNKSVLTSSNGAGTSGTGVTDGLVTSPSTIWQPTYSSDNWAQIDLGTSKTVCRVLIKWGRYNAPSSFNIQMSNGSGSGATWTDIAIVTNNNPTVGNENGDYYTQYVFNDLNITGSSNTGRYIRVQVGTIGSPNWFVCEMEVFETTASNSVPGATLTNPSSAITIPVNTPLSLTANASDPDGTISQVAFYNGTTLLGIAQQTASPYSYTWIPTVTGTYQVKAVATDNVGAIGNSLTVTVTVVPASASWTTSGNATTGVTDPFLGTSDNQPLIVKTGNSEKMRITADGKVLIGTSNFPPGVPNNSLLGVEGFIVSKGLKVTQTNWPDYVFARDYKLMPLPQLSDFIKKNKHLPGVPSVREVQAKGVNVGENQELLLRKIEELTLYIIKQDEKIEELKKKVEALNISKK